MPDLVFVWINCAQAVSKPVQPSTQPALEAIDRRSNPVKPAKTRFGCVSSPEMFRSLFVSDVESPKRHHSAEASASVLVAPERSGLPSWSTVWVLGWTMIYAAGWVVIVKQAVQERQTQRVVIRSPQAVQPPTPTRTPSPETHSTATKPAPVIPCRVEWLETAEAVEPAAPTSASAASELPSPSTPVPDLPEPELSVPDLPEIEVDEVLPVLAAEGGIARPLPGLFLDFNPLPMPPSPAIAPVPIQAPPLEEELVMMTLTLEGQGNQYAYILLDDGDGMFVLRSNELRLKPQGLEEQDPIEKTVTLRRIDQQGEFLDQSFNFHIQKLAQSAYAA